MGTSSSAVVAQRRPGRVWRTFKWFLLIILILVCATAVAGAAYQAIENARDARRFPQEGRSVALGSEFPGVSLNIHCTGQGSPAVIMDSGLGVPAVGWDFVQPEVAKFTHVCSYDRAGYGWSTPGPMPRTSQEIARELHALLAAAGEKGPYILVAHSFGGYNVRVYTKDYPQDVAGMVLVDTSHEDQNKLEPPSMQAWKKKQTENMDRQRRIASLMITFGVARLTNNDTAGMNIPKSFAEEVKYLELQPKFIEATMAEFKSFDESADAVRAAGNLGDRPLIVLTAGKLPDSSQLPAELKPEEMQAFEKLWIDDLQIREAHLSTRGKRILVADSSHMIPFLRPDTVISAIREVWDQARSDSSAAEDGAKTAVAGTQSATSAAASAARNHPRRVEAEPGRQRRPAQENATSARQWSRRLRRRAAYRRLSRSGMGRGGYGGAPQRAKASHWRKPSLGASSA